MKLQLGQVRTVRKVGDTQYIQFRKKIIEYYQVKIGNMLNLIRKVLRTQPHSRQMNLRV
jgi:hypothetical protein